MPVIPLSHHKDPAYFSAPLLQGVLHLQGGSWPLEFLVDTGAHTTSTNGGTIDGVKGFYDRGVEGRVDGVGGGWASQGVP